MPFPKSVGLSLRLPDHKLRVSSAYPFPQNRRKVSRRERTLPIALARSVKQFAGYSACPCFEAVDLAGQTYRNLQRPHLALTHPTPPYQHLLTTAGERQLSGGKSQGQVDGVGPASHFTSPSLDVQTGLPRASKIGSLHCWWPRRVAMVEPPVLYLQSIVPTAACDMAIVFRPTGYSSSACRIFSLRPRSLSYDASSALPPP
jgi:hypothetical protein